MTAAPYVPEFLVMPSRNMREDDATLRSVAVPVNRTRHYHRIAPASARRSRNGAPLFSRKYGRATGVVIFDRVFVPGARFPCRRLGVFRRHHLQPPTSPSQLHRCARRLATCHWRRGADIAKTNGLDPDEGQPA